MGKVIPTVFATNKKEEYERFEKLVGISDGLHIDFMDGKFVKSKGIEISDVPNLKRMKGEFEAHLMVKDPRKYIVELKEKGFRKFIFHIESMKSETAAEELVEFVKMEGLKVMVALNPATKIKKIEELLGKVDGVLFMGVKPGREHQKFISSVYKKIEELRRMDSKIFIQVDGGVNLKVAERLGKLGVNCVNTGSFVSDAENPREVIEQLERLMG